MAGDSAAPIRRRSLPRRIGAFLLTFAVSLVIGKAFESFSSCETMLAANKWQQRWYASVNAMAPISLATGYFRDVIYIADTGDFSMRSPGTSDYRDVPLPLTGCGALCGRTVAAETPRPAPVTEPPESQAPATTPARMLSTRDLLCGSLQGRIAYCMPNTAEYAGCVEANRPWKERFDAECAGWESPSVSVGPAPSILPTGILNERHSWHLAQFVAAPVAGLVMTFIRMVEPGGSAYLWAILQLGIGFLLWLFVRAIILEKTSRGAIWPDGFWNWAVGVPFGTVICASFLAFGMKHLMLGGLAVFGWFTCFAATACVATGAAGLCWYLVVKLAEHAVQEAAPA